MGRLLCGVGEFLGNDREVDGAVGAEVVHKGVSGYRDRLGVARGGDLGRDGTQQKHLPFDGFWRDRRRREVFDQGNSEGSRVGKTLVGLAP